MMAFNCRTSVPLITRVLPTPPPAFALECGGLRDGGGGGIGLQSAQCMFLKCRRSLIASNLEFEEDAIVVCTDRGCHVAILQAPAFMVVRHFGESYTRTRNLHV